MNKYYEATLVINGALEEEGVAQTLERVTEFLKRNGATIRHTEDWGRKRLTYQIDKKTNGYYIRIGFDGVADMIGRLERFLRLEEQVLRSLVLTLTERDVKQRSETIAHLAAIAAAEEAAAAAPAVIEPINVIDAVDTVDPEVESVV